MDSNSLSLNFNRKQIEIVNKILHLIFLYLNIEVLIIPDMIYLTIIAQKWRNNSLNPILIKKFVFSLPQIGISNQIKFRIPNQNKNMLMQIFKFLNPGKKINLTMQFRKMMINLIFFNDLRKIPFNYFVQKINTVTNIL